MRPTDPQKLREAQRRADKLRAESVRRYQDKAREKARERADNGDARSTPKRKPMQRTPLSSGPPGARTFARKGRPQNRHASNAHKAKRIGIKRQSAARQRENRQRADVLRAKYGPGPVACERCRQSEAHDAHEIVPRSAGGSIRDPENIRALCRKCHTEVHAAPAQAKVDGWLSDGRSL